MNSPNWYGPQPGEVWVSSLQYRKRVERCELCKGRQRYIGSLLYIDIPAVREYRHRYLCDRHPNMLGEWVEREERWEWKQDEAR